ncbi:MAG: transglycosylase domain-containing protein [Chitinophagaceae bacterium]|nr:transglycosylase domain-containing protein [Chitinophagaceae bacterium]
MTRSVRIFWRIVLYGFLAFILLILTINWGLWGNMPSITELENPTILQASEVYADDGTLMGKYYLDKGNRTNVRYKDLSPNVVNALVSTEDERFYQHSGIDYRRTISAVAHLGQKGGASTITQQLALNLFNSRSSNPFMRIIQKLQEWIIAIKLERNFTKEEIIALYLNAVSFSENTFGIRSASRTFFQKEPDQLNVQESALLIGMVNAPSLFNPRRNPKAARERRNVVINQMVRNKKLDAATAAKLKAEPIKLNYRKLDENTGYAPYFREVLRDELKKLLKDIKKPNGESYNIYNDALKIYTTINPRMQEYAEEAVTSHLPTMQKILSSTGKIKDGSVWKGFENVIESAMKQSDRWATMSAEGFTEKEIRRAFTQKTPMKVFAWNKNREKDTTMTPIDSIKYHHTIMQSSFMAMDPVTGEVKAWVGGINFKTFKYDHVNLNTKRQVGSSIKPLLYTMAMEERGFTESTECERVAQFFPGQGWVPAGKGGKGGTISFAGALAFSDNYASAFVMKAVEPGPFADFVSRLNIPTNIGPHPSNALGACDLSMYEMMWSYTIFAGRGFSTRPYYISRIEDRNGNVIKRFDYSVNRKEAISEGTAYRMARMMQGTVDFGTAAGLRNRIGVAELGGKTGTTNDNSDAWFMGYTPQLLGGVWVGCDDRFIRLNKNDARGYGGFAARPIWEYFFKKVMNDRKLGYDKNARFSKPSNLDLEINSADLINGEYVAEPGAEGSNIGSGPASGFEILENSENIFPDSKPVEDDSKPIRDTMPKAVMPKRTDDPKIGDAAPKEEKRKKGVLQKLFGKKNGEGNN